MNTTGKTVNMTLARTERYLTGADVATRIAQVIGHVPATVGVASGTVFPHALTGGAFIANAGRALLLTDPAALSASTRDLRRNIRSRRPAVRLHRQRR